MVEYITKSDAVFAACRVLTKFGACSMGPFCPDSGCREVREVFENVPAADVVEVRHGSWHRYSKGSGAYNGVIILSDAFQCTICKKSFWNKSNYCPNCGAVMDGGQEE